MIDPEVVKKYIGLPYASRGRSFEGVDCYGLLILFYKNELGIDLPDYYYKTAEDKQGVSAAVLLNIVDWQRLETPEDNAAVVINIGGLPLHIGMAVTKNKMLHTLKGHNCAFESFTKNKWIARIEGFYQWPKST